MRCSPSSTCLPAWPGKQLVGAALGWAGRWAELQAPGKFFLSVFSFFYFPATLLNY